MGGKIFLENTNEFFIPSILPAFTSWDSKLTISPWVVIWIPSDDLFTLKHEGFDLLIQGCQNTLVKRHKSFGGFFLCCCGNYCKCRVCMMKMSCILTKPVTTENCNNLNLKLIVIKPSAAKCSKMSKRLHYACFCKLTQTAWLRD